MDAMVAQSFISEEKRTPLSLEKIREADKQTGKLIVGFPARTAANTLPNSKVPEDLPTAQYKLDVFDDIPQFKSAEEYEIGEEGETANNGSASDGAGAEWYTGWEEDDPFQEETKEEK